MTGWHHAIVFGFLFVVGACFGSFWNVCVHRWPRGLSLLRPGSRCPHCLSAIRPTDNLPIVGWMMLRGRCRDCREPISTMYPAMEALLGTTLGFSYVLVVIMGDGDLLQQPWPRLLSGLAAPLLAVAGLVGGSMMVRETGRLPSGFSAIFALVMGLGALAWFGPWALALITLAAMGATGLFTANTRTQIEHRVVGRPLRPNRRPASARRASAFRLRESASRSG